MFDSVRRADYWVVICFGAAVLLTTSAYAKEVCKGDELTRLKARVWDTVNNPHFYPETADDDYKVPWVNDPDRTAHSFGVAFSGGGTRSAAATLGELRALHKLGWIDKAQYMSVISGGSWAAVPYIFVRDERRERLLGFGPSTDEYVAPDSINDDVLQRKDKESLALAISQSRVVFRSLVNLLTFKGDESYARTLSSIFLEPFDLHDPSKFFHHESTIDNVLAANPDLSRSDFYLAPDDRPYLIAGGVMFSRKEFDDKVDPQDVMFPLEMTPIYTGLSTGHVHTDVNLLEGPIGGGYLESFAYDSCAPSKAVVHQSSSDPWLLKSRSTGGKKFTFTLGDMIAISGAAPAEILATKVRYNSLTFPELHHWPITSDSVPPVQEIKHGDGGHIDNLGVMPLLARKVKNILVFVNTRQEFVPATDKNDMEIMENVKAFFVKSRNRKHIRVFTEKTFIEMTAEFKKDYTNGDPLVFCSKDTAMVADADVLDRFNISPDPGYKPNVCWVYLDRSMKWINRVANAHGISAVDHRNCAKEGAINADQCDTDGSLNITKSKSDKYVTRLVSKKKQFRNFPHYRTFGEQVKKLHVIDLKKVQVNALAHLTTWSILTAKDDINDALGLE